VRTSIVLQALSLGLLCGPIGAQPFGLPTSNHALLEPRDGPAFFVGTAGKPWTSGQFGCVRSDGWQMHEGLDIRCLQRDRKGEPTDPVLATADGTVAYCNRRAGLSNYGNYIVLRHLLDGVEIYSLYAHLRDIRGDLKPGRGVKAGETLGLLGRTSNTPHGIPQERAHVHFELNLLLNDRFSGWHRAEFPKERDDHGKWNGQNLAGLDPREIFILQAQLRDKFSLRQYVRGQTELCRVLVPDTSFPWLSRYALLIRRNPLAESQGIAAYEVALNYNGVPYQLVPRALSEVKAHNRITLISVNEPEFRKHPCRKLIAQHSGQWHLTRRGLKLIELLTY